MNKNIKIEIAIGIIIVIALILGGLIWLNSKRSIQPAEKTPIFEKKDSLNETQNQELEQQITNSN